MRRHIQKRVRTNAAGKETVRWYVVVDTGFDENGKRKQRGHGGFATRREAEVERAKIVSSLHSGGYVTPDRLTLGEWVRQSWLPMTKTRVKPSTFDSYRSNMASHVLPVLGSRALCRAGKAATAELEQHTYHDRGEGRRAGQGDQRAARA